MAEQNDDAQEKTQQPTPKRLADARRKGQVARSRELSTTLMLIGGGCALWLSADYLVGGIGDVMRANFMLTELDLGDDLLVMRQFNAHMLAALAALAPMLAAATVIAFAAPLALGGWTMSGEALLPKVDRLDPVKGLKRVFGAKGLMEALKAAAKFGLIMGFAVVALLIERDTVTGLSTRDIDVALADASRLLFVVFMLASAATIVVALIDVPFQLWQHGKQLRMSHKDLKDEQKETDGSPELKGRVRALQQEVARRRMMEEVPQADVVITNPEHYAVALKFDAETMAAPLVVAKGLDAVAANIRTVATSHGVTLVEAPPLARALYHTTRLNQEIPAGLYIAVARVLAYVFQLRAGDVVGDLPADLPIPEDMRH